MTNIIEEFKEYISDKKNVRMIPTGIRKLDEIYGGGLPTGLTILGAITGLGKTTFVLQLIDTIAKEENVKILFFSLELSKFELLSKSLSRLSYQNKELVNHTPKEFLSNTIDDADKYYAEYNKIADNIFLIDNITNIDDIRKKICEFVSCYGNDKVIIVIDYLQFIDCDDTANDKQNMDKIIKELKILSKSLGISIIAISSVNRSSYKSTAIGSFKESGSIEYTADYLILLMEKEKENTISFNNDSIIILSFLKNRFGEKGELELKYEGKYATFIEK